MKIRLVIFIFLICKISWASLVEVDPKCSCEASKQRDPYETPVKFNFGKFHGLCVDSCRFRSITVLQPDPDKIDSAKVIKVSNFLHMEKYYIAEIPISSLTQISIGFEEFHPHVFHVVLRFDLGEKGQAINLLDQTNQNSKAELIQTRSFVVSAEGVPPKDFPYGLVESYFGNYLLALRVLSIEEENRWVKKMNNTMTYKKLNLTEQQVQKMAKSALFQSHNNQMQSVYKLFTNNCATVAIETIQSALKNTSVKADIIGYADRGLSVRGPVGTNRFLLKNKLIEAF
ncbi:MAG: DUF4105 domain-containing protein [Bdellovibrionales bacterium]